MNPPEHLIPAVFGVAGSLILLGTAAAAAAARATTHRNIISVFLASISGWTPVTALVGSALLLPASFFLGSVGVIASSAAVYRRLSASHGFRASAHFDTAERPHGAPTVRLMSLNTLHGLVDATHVTTLVQSGRVDVLSLVEATADLDARLAAAGLGSTLPYRTPAVRLDGNSTETVIWSRYPILEHGPVPGTMYDAVQVRIQAPGEKTLTVVGVHPWNPIAGVAEWTADHTALEVAFANHPATEPLVIAGDFNATLAHQPLQALTANLGLSNASRHLPSWVANTWPTDKPFLPRIMRIDHILTNRAIQTTGFATFTVDGTDHTAVTADLHL